MAPTVSGDVQVRAALPATDLESVHNFLRSNQTNSPAGAHSDAARVLALAAVAPGADSDSAGKPSICGNCACVQMEGKKYDKCSRCLGVSYCSKACQVQHWKAAGGHKQACVVKSKAVKASGAAV